MHYSQALGQLYSCQYSLVLFAKKQHRRARGGMRLDGAPGYGSRVGRVDCQKNYKKSWVGIAAAARHSTPFGFSADVVGGRRKS